MKAIWIQRAVFTRHAWAVLGGLGLAAAFPKLGLAGLAWVAPGWILFAALGRRGGEVFRIGYVAGLAYALGAFYWLLFIPFPAGAIAGWLALSAYLAAYLGTWVWLCWKVFPKGRDNPAGQPLSHPGAKGRQPDGVEDPGSAWVASRPGSFWSDALPRWVRVPLPQRVLWTLGCAVIWVGLEMVLARLFTGFPWNLLGASQYRVLPVIQMAEVTGVYGVSFLVVWFSVSLAGASLSLLSRPTKSKGWVGDLALPLIVLVGVVAFGSSQLGQVRPAERTVRVALIQPSIPQTLIWDTNQNALRFTQLLELSELALKQSSDVQLLVWPEAAIPNMLRYEPEVYRAVTNLAITHNVWMILGSDDAAPRLGGVEREYDIFNSSFLVTPRGELASTYRKRRLVIFGEYIPLERWAPFMKYLTPVGGSFAAGREPMPFVIPELNAKASVLICFEDIFPHLGREYVETDTDFLLNLTNNGWFGESAAQWQHAANAVFRAVENRIPLVRCGNNGLTCWVQTSGAFGEISESAWEGSGPIYGRTYKIADVPLLRPGEQRELTFYNRHGDWFGWGCVGVTALLLGVVGAAGMRKLRRFPRVN